MQTYVRISPVHQTSKLRDVVTKMHGDRDVVDDDDSESGRTMRDGVEVSARSTRCRTGGGGGAQPRTPHEPLRGSPSQTAVVPLDLTDGSVIVDEVVGTEVISTSSASSSGVVFSPLNLTVPRVDVGGQWWCVLPAGPVCFRADRSSDREGSVCDDDDDVEDGG